MSVTMTAPLTHHFRLPIRTPETLREYVRLTQGFVIPDRRVCSNHSSPWDAYCDAYFSRAPVMVWKASRGLGGKTQLLASLAKVKAETQRSDASILGGSGEQSKRVLDALVDFWRYSKAPATLYGEVSRETRLVNGARITALMASSASARGAHPQFLAIDEVDECDIHIIDSALGQPMDNETRPLARACTVMSSTHHYADRTMTEILKRAAEKNWPVHEWCIHETREANGGWLSEEQIEKTHATMTSAQWENEVLLQEPSPESRAIQPEAVKRMFDRALGEARGAVGEELEFELPEPGARYAHGADWARKQDYTEVGTIRTDVKPRRLVAYQRTRRADWPVMVGILEKRMVRYPGPAAHDGTGLGDVIHGFLRGAAALRAEGIILAGTTRRDILAEYIAAVEHDDIRSPHIDSLEVQHRQASYDDVFGSSVSGHLPDGVCMMALAWHAAMKFGNASAVPPRPRNNA